MLKILIKFILDILFYTNNIFCDIAFLQFIHLKINKNKLFRFLNNTYNTYNINNTYNFKKINNFYIQTLKEI